MKSHWEPTPEIPGTIEMKPLLGRFKPYSIEGVACIPESEKVLLKWMASNPVLTLNQAASSIDCA